MNKWSFSIGDLPFRRQLLLMALVWAAAGYSCYSWYVQGLQEEVAQLDNRIQELHVDLNKARNIEARLAEFQSATNRQRQQLDDFRRNLPSKKDTAELMKNIHDLALENSLHIKAFTPQATEPRDSYSDWPIRMTMEGNYHNLATFFEKVGKMQRLVNIEDISLQAAEDGTARSRTLEATCTAITFVYLEDLSAQSGVPAPDTVNRRKELMP